MRQREDTEKISLRILREAEAELYLAFRFMAPALSAMPFVFDTSTQSLGTDSESFFYNAHFLMQTYLQHPYMVNRAYMHVVLHCLFRHMHSAEAHLETADAAGLFDMHEPDGTPRDGNHELWDLSADIAVEHVLDSLDADAVRRTPNEFREEWYRHLENDVSILTAERLFRYFQDLRADHAFSYDLLMRLTREFTVDDHSFWYRERKKESTEQKRQGLAPEQIREKENEWKQAAKRVREEIDARGRKGSSAAGRLDRMLSFSVRRRRTYRELLRHFTIEREECRIDPDSFDYGFYYYGFEHYGNMPLIEENEYTESRKIRDFVIAVDTSASISDRLISRFLQETADVLLGEDLYFQKGAIHILLADTQVRRDTVLQSAAEMKNFSDGFHIQGGGGTDFRPVFRYVEDLQAKGDLRDLKGLIYFTDGLGTYPRDPTPYETVFVFARDDLVSEKDIPPWIIPIFLPEE